MCYFKQGTISRMLFRGMLFALLAVCYPEYSRAVIAEDYQANRLITLSMKNISVADIIGQIRKTTDYRFLFQVDDLKGVRNNLNPGNLPFQGLYSRLKPGNRYPMPLFLYRIY